MTRPKRTRCTSSTTAKDPTTSFYSANKDTNLCDLITKAASHVCGGDFILRDSLIPCKKYILYNINCMSKGNRNLCQTVHERDNASCSLQRVDTQIAVLYTLSISCYRYKPPPRCHKYKKVFTIMKNNGKWTIKPWITPKKQWNLVIFHLCYAVTPLTYNIIIMLLSITIIYKK